MLQWVRSLFGPKPDAAERIRSALRSPEPEVRTKASFDLLAHPTADLTGSAVEALTDSERVVRCNAGMYLGDYGGVQHVEALKRCWLREHHDGAGSARAAFYGAIQKLTGKSVGEMAKLLDDLLLG
jgi:HEAT repeat protein